VRNCCELAESFSQDGRLADTGPGQTSRSGETETTTAGHDGAVTISTEDRLAIHELIALHGHLMDEGQLDQLTQLFTDDVAYDLTPMDGPVLRGVDAVRQAAQDLGPRNPVAHLVTNTVVDEEGGSVIARSKFLGVQRDGSFGSGTYDDQLRYTADGWRICTRRVSLRREPLTP